MKIRISATFLVFLIILPGWLNGASIHVPDDYDTIQDAIDNADPGDTIIVARGTYTGTGNKNLDFGGLAITVRGEGCREETIIDCNGSGRGFHFQSGEGSSSVVENLTIREGVATYGAGIYCHNNSNPTISNCIITDGSGGLMGGGHGSGICCIDSSPTISNCTIKNNSGANGGGIYCENSSPTISHCIIADNSVVEVPGSGAGGGIYCTNSTPIIDSCTIVGNTSGTLGGPMYLAGYGGGLWLRNGSNALIEGCLIACNAAADDGGAIHCGESSPLIINCTIVNNLADHASTGAGLQCFNNATPTIKNCIMWDDTPDEIFVASGTVTVSYSDIDGGYPGTLNINSDPKFVDSDGADNDADTWEDNDYHLQSNSPCIDLGHSTSAPQYDIEDWPRCDYPPAGPGGGVFPYYDMGAYEFRVYFYVNVSTGSDLYTGLAPDKAKATIQAAIDASTAGSVILVAEGVYSGAGNNDLNFNFGANIVPLRSMKGPDVTVIDCGGTGRGFDLRFEKPGVIVDGFKVVDAADSGMYIWASDIEVTNCILVENAGINGGGIEIEQCDVTISNCIITGNTASSNGGGVYHRDDAPSLINCLIIGNEASGNGGGIACYYGSYLNVENCTIADNTATGDGGGLYCLTSYPTLTNCILWDNSPDEIFLSSGTMTVTYSDVEGGYAGTGNIDSDPLFKDPVGSEDYSLRSESPCIDAGTSANTPTEDMLGAPRFDEPETPNTGGGTSPYYDMGAYELIHGFFVNGGTGSDCYDGLARQWNGLHGPKKTVQGGVDAATKEGTVYVAQGTYTGPGNRDVDIDSKPLTLKSEDGAAVTIIDCQGQARAMYIHDSNRKSTRIEGFTIQNGSSDRGGAIRCEYNLLEVVDCIIKENTATWSGGGVYASQSPLLAMTNCSIYGNIAEYGGGILCDAVHGELINCTITGNEAYNLGGGVYWEFPDLIATNCTFTGNKAGTNGGAFYCVTTSVFTNCILWDDTPNEIFLGAGGAATVDYSDVQGGYPGTSNINQIPVFVDAGQWSVGVWMEGVYHLQVTSPCIDVGDNSAPFIPGFDKDGNHRIWFGTTSCTVDMGAYEYLSEALAITDMVKTVSGIDITWTSSPSPGVTYDVWYSDDPLSDAMSWSIIAADVPTGGSTTTWTDTTNPMPYRRFYKVSY